jgi:hypothetical protein
MLARYQCLQEAGNQSLGGGYIGQSGGSYSSQTAPSCGMIASCMSIKGYSTSAKGRFAIPAGAGVRCI